MSTHFFFFFFYFYYDATFFASLHPNLYPHSVVHDYGNTENRSLDICLITDLQKIDIISYVPNFGLKMAMVMVQVMEKCKLCLAHIFNDTLT